MLAGAILYDLGVGDSKIRPTAESGYKACEAASAGKGAEGNVGAGAGATVGKMFGAKLAMKCGIGTASVRMGKTDIVVAPIVAVNAVGDVVDPKTGRTVAGARKADGSGFLDSIAQIGEGRQTEWPGGGHPTLDAGASHAKL